MENFAVNRLADHFPENGIIHHLIDKCEPAENRRQHIRGMRAVQETHLAGAVRRLIIRHNHIQPALLQRQFPENGFWSLHHEEMENFAAVEQIVLITEFRANLFRLGTRITGDNAVHQRVDEQTAVLKPRGKFLRETPVGGIMEHVRFQRRAVPVDKLAGNENKSLRGIAAECFPAFKYQTRQFGGIGILADTRRIGLRLVFNARLRGVGKHETEIRIDRRPDDRRPVGIRIQTAFDGFNDFTVFHNLAVGNAAQNESVKTILRVDEVRQPGRKRLHKLNKSVELALFIHFMDHPVNECAKKISFSELENLDGKSRSGFTFQQFHNRIPSCSDFIRISRDRLR